MTEFQELCLSFVSSAKGSTAVNYIETNEPLGTDASTTHDSIEDNSVELNIDEIDPDPTFRFQSKIQKVSAVNDNKSGRTGGDSWKEKYFKSMITNDAKFNEAGIRKADLKSYNLLLKNIQLEKSLGLCH